MGSTLGRFQVNAPTHTIHSSERTVFFTNEFVTRFHTKTPSGTLARCFRKALIHNSHPKTRSREITHHTVTAAPKIGTTSPIGLRHATLGPTAKSTERLRDVAPSSEVIIVNIFPSAYQKYSVEGAEKNVHSAKNDTLTRTHRH